MTQIGKIVKQVKKDMSGKITIMSTDELRAEIKKTFADVGDLSFSQYKLLSGLPNRTKDEDLMLIKYEHKHIINDRNAKPTPPPAPTPKVVTWEQVKAKFIKTALEVTNNDLGFVIDDENQHAIIWLLRYFVEAVLPQGVVVNKQSLNKGVIIAGNVGSGKSVLFKIIHKMGGFKRTRFTRVTAYDVVSEYEQHGETAIQKYLYNNLLIDELGAEEIANRYGKKENLFKRILEFRYNLWHEQGKRTYITTNLTPGELTDRYGLRFGSRMNEMFNILYLGAKADSRDFRKLL